MSKILFSTVKYSLTKFGINSFRTNSSPTIRPYLNHISKCNFQTTVRQENAIDTLISRLDHFVRRSGRLSIREVEKVVKEIANQRSASSTQSLLIIRCCGNLLMGELPDKRTELVQKVWSELESIGIKLDISHYNALLRVYLENEYPFAPSEILSKLEEKGIEPNRVTYQRLLARYCQNGDIEGATRILQFMKDKEMPINENVFNSLILGHCRANDIESAEGILNVMKQAGINPSADTYVNLINGYIKQGNINKIEEVLRISESDDILFLDKDYLNIVYNLAVDGRDPDIVLSKVKKGNRYNQEAINCTYRLINVDKTEVAFKVMKSMVRNTRLNGTYMPSGNFFISYLVQKDKSGEDIVKYCDLLTQDNLNSFALNCAMESCFRHKKLKLALELFKAAKERNIPIRRHYFWPLLVEYGKANEEKELLNILASMHNEYNLVHSGETLRDYVIPFLLKDERDIPSLLLDLKSCGVSYANSNSALVLYYLNQNNIAAAAKIACMYSAYYPTKTFKLPIITSFLATRDVESLTRILKQIAIGVQKKANTLESEEKEDEDFHFPEYRECVGSILSGIVRSLQNESDGIVLIEAILKKLQEKGIGISSAAAEKIQSHLLDHLTENISSLLEKLISDEFHQVEITPNQRFIAQKVDETTLERLYESMKQKGESLKGIQKQLYNIYGRQHNLEKLLKLKEELDRENFVFNGGMKAYLIESYLENGKVDEALSYFHSCCENEPDFMLHKQKQLKFVVALVEKEKYEDAVFILRKKGIEYEKESIEADNFLVRSLCWRILNHFAEKGDLEKLEQFFNLIAEIYIEPNNIILGSFIKAHVVKNDLSGALKEFERLCVKYKVTPWKNELAKRFIMMEDAISLQRLTDLSTQIHGEMNSLYDLMLSFLECGRIKQAKKILETPGFYLKKDRFDSSCQSYQNSGAVDHLQNLLIVTKDMNMVDRRDVYYNLLLVHDKGNNTDEALSLWMQMQEEDVQPSTQFLLTLGKLLQRNGKSVPFEIPSKEEITVQHKPSQDKVQIGRQSLHLRKLLQNKDIDEALKLLKREKNKFNNTDLSLLMEALLKENRYKDASEVMQEFLSRDTFPIKRIFLFFLNQCALNNDIELIELIAEKIPEKTAKSVAFDNRKCSMYINAGLEDKFLADLEKQLDSVSTEEEFNNFIVKFPKTPLLYLLENDPEKVSIVERISEKCIKRDSKCLVPFTILWMYHIAAKNYEKADDLWKKYLQRSERRINFRGLLNLAQKKKDLELVERLKSYIVSLTGVTPDTIGLIYGKMLSILVLKDEVEEAVVTLEKALKEISIDNISMNDLITLKSACIAKNIPFKYEIQSSNLQVSDSDSD